MNADTELVMRLYREAMTLSGDAFQASAIRSLRLALRFESAIWGRGYFGGPGPLEGHLIPLQVHTHEVDPAALEQWKAINRADKVIPIVLATPRRTHAFHAPTLFAGKTDSAMRDYARRFGRQSYLITAFGSPDSTLREWCSFYRPDAQDRFTVEERERCEVLTNHLIQAFEVNSLCSNAAPSQTPRRRTDEGAETYTALAVPTGRLVSAQTGFTRACAQQWPEFDGRTLPMTVLRPLLHGAGTVRLARLTLSGQPIADLWWLRLQVKPGPALLPPRRLDVAALFAHGHSTKQIAVVMGLAHSTVRNQLIAAYRTLGVSDRSGLRARLGDAGFRRPL